MSRPLRIEYEGAWYHVMNRGRGRATTFPDERTYQVFLETVAEAQERFRLQVHAYCLMPNHYHLLVRTPLANLARGMRHIDGLYTQRHNRLVGTDGPLFRGRYKAILVDADAYLLAVSRYIHRNPIDGRRPLVGRLEDWSWSSYPAYVGSEKAPAWLVREDTYGALGRQDRHQGYRLFVEAGVEEEVAAFYGRRRQSPMLGDAGFQERVLRRVQAAEEVPRHEQRRWLAPEQVLAAVARHYGLSVERLTARGDSRAVSQARQMAMWLCQQETGLTLRALGELFGGVHYSTVVQNIRRLRQAAGSAENLSELRRAVMSRLDP
jgi:putative transposase